MHWSEYFFFIRKMGLRYFIIAGTAFLIFYQLPGKAFFQRKIQKKFPRPKDYAREIVYSVITVFIFAAVPLLIVGSGKVRIHTYFYTDAGRYGWLYFWLVFPLMFFIHDTYFYWTHRLMHHPRLFRWFHLVHHRSTNPSPWAAYAFHPLEAIVEAGIFAVFLFSFPVTAVHLGLFFLIMIVYNVYGHLGYELYPKGFSRHWLGRWINTSVNHNQHHQYFKGNYGLYFLFWDRLLGTVRKDYEEKFEQLRQSGTGPTEITRSEITRAG